MRTSACLLLVLSSLLIGCSRWTVDPKQYYSSMSRADLETKPYVLYDLDQGGVKGSDNADFYWRAIDRNSFYMAPTNGAALAATSVPDPWNIPYPDLAKQSYATSTITAYPNNGSIAYITNQGRYGALRINSYDFTNSSLKITWVTYTR